MKYSTLAAAAVGFTLFAASARADDAILRRDKNGKEATVAGTIVEESPAGIKVKTGKDIVLVPTDDILTVGYGLKDIDIIEFGTPYGKEQQALGLTGEDRKKGLAEALTLYEALQKRLKAAPNAERFIAYRMAMTAVELAKDDATKTQAAIAALNKYRTSNSGGWEIVPATRTLAHLLEDAGQADAARQAYEELAANPRAASARLRAAERIGEAA